MKTTIYCAVIFLHGLSLLAVADQNTVGPINAVGPIAADQNAAAFIEKYCIQCHGDQKQKADRRFDTLSSKIKTLDDLGRYQEVVDQLNLESMPPEGKPQPSPGERLAMIDSLTRRIKNSHTELSASGGHSVLRRLNAWEYRQTIGDLLGLNVDVWDPSEDFPEEVVVDGFDNNGAGLVTSGILMEHYLRASEEAIRRATNFGERPVSTSYTQTSPFYFSGKGYEDLPKLFKVDRFRFTPDTPFTDLYGRHYRGGHI